MRDRGVGSWIERRRRVAPDRVALVHGGTRRTYADVADRVARLSTGLRDLGVGRGDRVVWRGPNHPAFLEALFATARLGAVLAPINQRLGGARTAALMSDYAPVVVVEHAVDPATLPVGVHARVVTGGSDGADLDYEQLVESADTDTIDVGIGDLGIGWDEPCLLPHTSGTTGPPRGVVLTHGNVTANVVNLLSVADFRGDDVTIAIAPFFRSGGTGVNVLPVLFKGGTVVVPESSGPDEILDLAERERVTIGFGNPDLLEALTRSDRWPTADLSTIRWFITGGAPVPEHLIRTYLARGVTFLQGYGLSEAAPAVLLLDADHALDKVGSAGTPPLYVDVRIARPDGTDCAVGETGELLVQGPNVMAGYWHHTDETAATLGDDGWLRTGDAARMDEQGYVWIVDRVGDAYESSGRVVYPGDVERVLSDHPDVREVGVRAGTAFVVLEPGATADAEPLLAHCRRRLASHEVPSAVVFVDRLPRSSVGKLLRHELRVGPD